MFHHHVYTSSKRKLATCNLTRILLLFLAMPMYFYRLIIMYSANPPPSSPTLTGLYHETHPTPNSSTRDMHITPQNRLLPKQRQRQRHCTTSASRPPWNATYCKAQAPSSHYRSSKPSSSHCHPPARPQAQTQCRTSAESRTQHA